MKVNSWIVCMTAFLNDIHGLPLEGIYFEAKPFIFTEGNQTKGILPDYFDALKESCGPSKAVIEYKLKLDSEKKFRELYESDIPYGSSNLKDIGSEAVWLPIIFTTNKQTRPVLNRVIIYTPSIALFAKQSQIKFTYKLWLGIETSAHVVVLGVLMAILFAILIWMTEWLSNPDFSKSFVKGGCQGFWCAFVTMTTVGYGDLVPKSFAGRLITMVWMFIGIIIASLVTATVSDQLAGVDHLSIKKDTKVGVMRQSQEKYSLDKDYDGNVKEYDTHEQLLDAVRNDDVLIAAINYDTAGYIHRSMNDGQTTKLSIVKLLESEVAINIAIPVTGFGDVNFTECAFKLQADLNESTKKYRKFVHVETIYKEPLLDMFKEGVILYFTITVGGLVVVGMIFEIVWQITGRIQKKQQKKLTANGDIVLDVIQNGHVKKVDNPKNTSKLEQEIAKLRNDITVVKDNIVKLSTMSQYNQKCAVCSWQN